MHSTCPTFNAFCRQRSDNNAAIPARFNSLQWQSLEPRHFRPADQQTEVLQKGRAAGRGASVALPPGRLDRPRHRASAGYRRR